MSNTDLSPDLSSDLSTRGKENAYTRYLNQTKPNITKRSVSNIPPLNNYKNITNYHQNPKTPKPQNPKKLKILSK